jgi:hypothetical protein
LKVRQCESLPGACCRSASRPTRRHIVARLRTAFTAGELRFSGTLAALAGPTAFAERLAALAGPTAFAERLAALRGVEWVVYANSPSLVPSRFGPISAAILTTLHSPTRV